MYDNTFETASFDKKKKILTPNSNLQARTKKNRGEGGGS